MTARTERIAMLQASMDSLSNGRIPQANWQGHNHQIVVKEGWLRPEGSDYAPTHNGVKYMTALKTRGYLTGTVPTV